MLRVFLACLFAVGLSSCSGDDLEKEEFNVLFYSGGQEQFLGAVSGLSACQSAASAKATSTNLSPSSWSYVCCKKTATSDCASKHK